MSNDKLIIWLTKYRNYKFIQVVRQTMLILFPVILVGAFSYVLSNCVFNSESLIGQITHIRTWFPQFNFVRAILGDIYSVTTGLLTVYAAAVSADVTLKINGKRNIFANIFSVVLYLLIFHHAIRNNQNIIEMRYYTAYWFIFGVVFGYLVGYIFLKFGEQDTGDTRFVRYSLLDEIRKNVKAIIVTLVIALALHILYAIIRSANLDTQAYQMITAFFEQHSNYWLSLLMSLITTLTVWFGFPDSMQFSNTVFSNEAWINLNHVLQNKSYSNLPYPFTPSSFFNAFAMFGGAGCSLALIVGVLLVTKARGEQRIVMWSSFPAIFNASMPLSFGVPIMLNPIFLIPCLAAPLLNMFLGSIAIGLRIIPPLVYPTPAGTPGILVPLVASGGNWITILIVAILLIIDILIYIPFVKLAERVEWQVMLEREQADEKEN